MHNINCTPWHSRNLCNLFSNFFLFWRNINRNSFSTKRHIRTEVTFYLYSFHCCQDCLLCSTCQYMNTNVTVCFLFLLNQQFSFFINREDSLKNTKNSFFISHKHTCSTMTIKNFHNIFTLFLSLLISSIFIYRF